MKEKIKNKLKQEEKMKKNGIKKMGKKKENGK